ncbi:hypothetical protein SUGI_0827080 [Cryptomeria japonica]|nr:hypothetical protein SUGI_0827080 [Cryptomeria japonica]
MVDMEMLEHTFRLDVVWPLPLKYEKVDGVSITFYYDCAANQGQLYKALNMAALWNFPVVLVCEDNHYDMGTTEWRATKCYAYYKYKHYVPGLKILENDLETKQNAILIIASGK